VSFAAANNLKDNDSKGRDKFRHAVFISGTIFLK